MHKNAFKYPDDRFLVWSFDFLELARVFEPADYKEDNAVENSTKLNEYFQHFPCKNNALHVFMHL